MSRVMLVNHGSDWSLMGMELHTCCLASKLMPQGHRCAFVAETYSHMWQLDLEGASCGVHPTSVARADGDCIPTGQNHGDEVRCGGEHVWRDHESRRGTRSHEDADYFYYSIDHMVFIRAWWRYTVLVSRMGSLGWIEEICRAK